MLKKTQWLEPERPQSDPRSPTYQQCELTAHAHEFLLITKGTIPGLL